MTTFDAPQPLLPGQPAPIQPGRHAAVPTAPEPVVVAPLGEVVDIATLPVDDSVLRLMPDQSARQLAAMPIRLDGRVLTFAVVDAEDWGLLADLQRRLTGYTIKLIAVESSALRRRIEAEYSARGEAARVAENQSEEAVETAAVGGDLGVLVGEGTNRRVFQLIMEEALSKGASDIHIDSTESGVWVRQRLDGELYTIDRYNSATLGAELVNLIKVEAGMPTDQNRTPDSGGLVFKRRNGGAPVDVRVETTPSAWGQSAVLRLQTEVWRDIDTLGFSATNRRRYAAALEQPYGVILATGPTGSGKTTLLMSSVRNKMRPGLKVISLEEPVEYKAPEGITQISVNDETGMTFERGLRSIVRQDPNVVLVGEIRDAQTADVALQLSSTGHLMLSTLHTPDAAGVFGRLARMGVDPHFLAENLLCVVGQRLVRRLCVHCRIASLPATAEELVAANIEPAAAEVLSQTQLFEENPAGCVHCSGGFAGRTAIHEVMLMTPQIESLVVAGAPKHEIHAAAVATGMTPMRADGFEKVRDGITSIAELNSETHRNMLSMAAGA